jgi:tetratricopeptide (TPR) repeat protein
LPVTDVADEVERNLGFLDAPTRDAPPRERSLRAAVAYSWKRLPAGARTVLLRASVFRGAFSRAAAAAVAGADAAALAALVDASLLDLDGEGRYRLHPVVADYARDRLRGRASLAAATRRRHRRWFVSRLAAWRARMGGGPEQQVAVQAFGRQLPDLQQAWDEAVAGDRAAELYALARTVAMFFELAHRFREGGDVLARSEAQLDRSNPAHVAALGGLDACWAWHHLRRGSLDAARERARTAVATLAEHGDAEGEADARHALAATLAALGAPSAARAQADAALHRVRAEGMPRETARLEVLAASLDAAEGDAARARGRLGEAVRLLRRVDDRRSLTRTLIARAEIARRSGDRDAAARHLRTATRMAEEEGMPEEGRRASTLLATFATDAVRA